MENKYVCCEQKKVIIVGNRACDHTKNDVGPRHVHIIDLPLHKRKGAPHPHNSSVALSTGSWLVAHLDHIQQHQASVIGTIYATAKIVNTYDRKDVLLASHTQIISSAHEPNTTHPQ